MEENQRCSIALSLITGQVSEIIRLSFEKTLKTDSRVLTMEEFSILACLIRKNLITQQVLGKLTLKDKTKITRLIDQLEKKLLVKRIADKNDRRKNIISITNQGVVTYEELNIMLQELYIKTTTNIDKSELTTFDCVIETIIKNVSHKEIKPSVDFILCHASE